MKPFRIITSLTIAAALCAAGTGSAIARDGDVEAAGKCTQRSTAKIKAGPRENRALEVEFEVDENVNGRVWDVELINNGVRVYHSTRTTVAPSGSFEVDRAISNRPGNDVLTGKARNFKTGETCSATVTVTG